MSKRNCSLHATDLHYGTIEIRRGMPPAPPVGYLEAQQELFPRARSFEMGGCVVGPDDKDSRRTLFCSECRRAEAEWIAARKVAAFWKP